MGSFDWQLTAQVSIGALVGYIAKNFVQRTEKILGTV